MTKIAETKETIDLPVIEVPPELRGLSDEEIIQRSQKEIREISGKRKKGERRPSKRAREALKQQKAHQEAMAIFKPRASLSQDKLDMVKKAFTSQSESLTLYDRVSYDANDVFEIVDDACEVLNSRPTPAPKKTIKSIITAAPAPTSGRVLKASFGAKQGEKPKAIIVSAAELAKQKAEERAKKIREALSAKRKAASAATPPPLNPDGTPVKRPRGRPRKNPIA